MNLKTSLLLTLACAAISPSSLYAAPKPAPAKKTAKPQVEYCLVTLNSGVWVTVSHPDGSETTINKSSGYAAFVLSKLARSGWRIMTCVGTDNVVWTLERRK